MFRKATQLALGLWLAATDAGLLHAAGGAPADDLTLLKIRVVEGEGTIRATGSRVSKPLIVQITDQAGSPVSAAVVTFQLPYEGPGGQFSNGLRTEVIATGADGLAAAPEIHWNQTPGPFQVRVIAAKDRVRAVTVISELLSEARPARTSPSWPMVAANKRSSRAKWIAIAALAAGGAAGAVLAGRSANSGPAPPAAPRIGNPTIGIGRP